MTLKQISLVSCAALLLAACDPAADQEALPSPPETSGKAPDAAPEIMPAQVESDNTVSEGTASIDWQAARTDMASRSGDDEPLVDIASASGTPPPVPILLPTGGPVRIAADGTGPRFKQTSDGYYAVYPYENYDVIVNGTNEVIGDRPDGARDEAMKFTATVAGAQVSLSRYGADYLIEFECYELEEDAVTCVEEQEAMSVAESLVIRGTR